MNDPNPVQLWKVAPFIRLLLPLVAGILLYWLLQVSFFAILVTNILFSTTWIFFQFLPLSVKYKLRAINGLLLNLVLAGFGFLLCWQNDIRHNSAWFGNDYRDGDYLAVRINEPLDEKAKTYKADGVIEFVVRHDSVLRRTGKILVYFSKYGSKPSMRYGDIVLVNKKLQVIKNSGNPGAFDYERYAGFQQVFHNVFLKEKDWENTRQKNPGQLKQFIFSSRENILAILSKNIPGKDELGIAQALLIGYTNDLDKDLVQAYSNTGVVHIIAISGMHLGLIYVMLVWIFKRLPLINRSKLLQVMLILGCLWLFSLLTGASASVVRAAVMFTFIAVGNCFKKNPPIYNSLAASAFVMLCYNPNFIWDVGFQLSYLAVIGIILFQKPVYNWLYVKNKWLDKGWQLAAISIAAQVLTFPVCIYYFHQFPNLFLLTNIIAVPLSSIILYAEIGLVSVGVLPLFGLCLGKVTGWLVEALNIFIVWMSRFPFAVWDNIPATLLSTCLLYMLVIFSSGWLLNKQKNLFLCSVATLLCFVMEHAIIKWRGFSQQKFIVYNVSRHQAIDFVNGNSYRFVGDSSLVQPGILQNFNLKPSRLALHLTDPAGTLKHLSSNHPFFQFNNLKVLLVDKAYNFDSSHHKVDLDIIIFSHNPNESITQLAAVFNCKQYVFDASNSLWKIDKWRKECEELHLRSYSVSERGAFIIDIIE